MWSARRTHSQEWILQATLRYAAIIEREALEPVHPLQIKIWTLSQKGVILQSNTQNTAVQKEEYLGICLLEQPK